jgi:hypothetical protein
MGTAGPLTDDLLWRLTGRDGLQRNLLRRLRLLSKPWERREANLLWDHKLDGVKTPNLFSLTNMGAARIGLPYEPGLLSEVWWDQIRHILMTGETFVALMELSAGAESLPFTWRGDRGHLLKFDGELPGRWQPNLLALRPDVVIDSEVRAVRLFVEFETGSHSIESPKRNAENCLLNKVRRYAAFFKQRYEDKYRQGTHYALAFMDDLLPTLVVVVHSARRRKSVLRRLGGEDVREELTGVNVEVVAQEDAGQALHGLLVGSGSNGTAGAGCGVAVGPR